jgi:hypothetical protein
VNERTSNARNEDARLIGLPYGSGMHTTPEDRPIYRLLTGPDDRAFCERVSEALEQGWRLYGSPAMTYDAATGAIKVAQAVVWHEADVVK